MEQRSAERMRLKNASVYVYGDNESGEVSVRLEDIGLAISPGEWLNVVGVNGSGKSTLARLLAGLHMHGAVGDLSRGFAGEGVSPIVLQQPRTQLFGDTPREEVTFALEWRGIAAEKIEPLAKRALELAGLIELADEKWSVLSGGQQQLAAIAAATAAPVPLIVLDEVTSMLDESNRDSVLRVAHELNRAGTSIVWVTQRLDELEPDSRTVALREGRLFYDGPTRDFLYGSVPDGAEGSGTSPISPCLRAGLRLPYLASLAIELRGHGKLSDPLPVTAEEWKRVIEQDEKNNENGRTL